MEHNTTSRSIVTAAPPASTARAVEHFGGLLAVETHCWDVHALETGRSGFLLVDDRGVGGWEAGQDGSDGGAP